MCNCVLPFSLPSFSPPCVHTLSSSSEVGRLVWSLVRHCSVKLANFGVLGGDNQYWSTSSTNRRDCTDHFLGTLRRGGGFRGIRNRALIGCMLHRAERRRRMRRRRRRRRKYIYLSCCLILNLRGSPSAISIAVMPRDHWSLCKENKHVCNK